MTDNSLVSSRISKKYLNYRILRSERNLETTREINALGDDIASRLTFERNFSTSRETIISLLQRFFLNIRIIEGNALKMV